MALDFAVTSGLRSRYATLQDRSASLLAYEDHKRTHLDTAALCAAEGLGFTPMVVEAVGGGWGPAAAKMFSELAKAKSGESEDFVANQLYQRLGVILHRENARAVLKRVVPRTSGSAEVFSAATALQSAAADIEM